VKLKYHIKIDNIDFEMEYSGWFIKPDVAFHESIDRLKELKTEAD